MEARLTFFLYLPALCCFPLYLVLVVRIAWSGHVLLFSLCICWRVYTIYLIHCILVYLSSEYTIWILISSKWAEPSPIFDWWLQVELWQSTAPLLELCNVSLCVCMFWNSVVSLLVLVVCIVPPCVRGWCTAVSFLLAHGWNSRVSGVHVSYFVFTRCCFVLF